MNLLPVILYEFITCYFIHLWVFRCMNRVKIHEYVQSLKLFILSTATPMFVIKPQDQKIGVGGSTSFECVARGNPPPSVFWNKEGSQAIMFPGNKYGRMEVSSEAVLTINDVVREDSGYVVCSALSLAGSATARAFLQV